MAIRHPFIFLIDSDENIVILVCATTEFAPLTLAKPHGYPIICSKNPPDTFLKVMESELPMDTMPSIKGMCRCLWSKDCGHKQLVSAIKCLGSIKTTILGLDSLKNRSNLKEGRSDACR